MAVWKCGKCGGDLAITSNVNVLECEFCGTRQTVPNADDEKKITLYNRATRLRINGEFDRAAMLYESIVSEFPEEAEAYWGLCLCNYGIEYVDDPATGRKVPTCHRASFESLMKDENYELALEYADVAAQKIYRDDAREIDRIMSGILEVSRSEKPYDIFISYKETDEIGSRTADSVLAYDIYEALTAKGYKVFFSRVSLEDKLGMQYEPYIFAALNSAKIMLCIGTKYEYFHAVWVKNEWARFMKLAARDKSKMLIPCYKDMDPYDMPDAFKSLQAQDLGKLGAMQDLLRGIEKILPKNSAPTRYADPADIEDRLRKVQIQLENRQWKDVQDGCKAILSIDPECAMAYVYQLARISRVTKIEDFEKCVTVLSESSFYEKALRCADPKLATQLEAWCRCSEENNRKATELCAPARERARKLDGILGGGKAHTVGLKTDGTVISCGSNEKGQRNVGFWRDIVYVACGDYHTVGLRADGTVVACGDNEKGQCDVGSWKNIVHISCDAYHTVGICADGTVVACGSNENGRCDVSQWENIMSGACGYRHTVVQDTNGRMYAVGANGKKQCNVTGWKKIVSYCANNLFTVGLKEDGTVVACGDNEDGAIDIRLWRNIVAVSSGTHHTVGLMADGSVVTCGSDGDSRCSGTKDWRDIVAISCGAWHTMGIRANGTIIHCGDDGSNKRDLDGWKLFESVDTIDEERLKAMEERKEKDLAARALRKETTRRQFYFRSVLAGGESFTVALLPDMTAISCGSNEGNQRLVRGLQSVLSVSCGKDFTVALLYDGERQYFSCLGNNEYGQCGMPVLTERRVKAVSCGYQHTAVLYADGTVYAVGNNSKGQCNVDLWHDIVSVACGWDYTVGLKADGTVVACGGNDFGQLNVHNWSDIVMIDVRNTHTVGLAADGSVVACGNNGDGQCDVADWRDIIAISCGSHHTVGLKADGTIIACGVDTGERCSGTSSWRDIVGIRCSYWVTLGIKRDGTVVACGDNGSGQCNLNGYRLISDVENFVSQWSYLEKYALDSSISDRAVLSAIPRIISREKIIIKISAVGTCDYNNMWPAGSSKTTFNCNEDYMIAFIMDVSQYALSYKRKIHLGATITGPNGDIALNDETELNWASNLDRISKTFYIRRKDGSTVKTGRYHAVFWVDNSETYSYDFTVTSNTDKIIQDLTDPKKLRRAKGLCQHCGGEFKGFFTQKCRVCGRPKDY